MKSLIQDTFLFLPKIRDVINMNNMQCQQVFCMSLISERFYSIYQHGMIVKYCIVHIAYNLKKNFKHDSL